MTKLELQTEIINNVLTGGNRTKAEGVRGILNDILDSYVNIEDGGFLYQPQVGYSTVLTLTDNRAFAHKKYVDDAVAAGGGAIPYTGDITYLPRITGVNGSGNITGMGQSDVIDTDALFYVLKSGADKAISHTVTEGSMQSSDYQQLTSKELVVVNDFGGSRLKIEYNRIKLFSSNILAHAIFDMSNTDISLYSANIAADGIAVFVYNGAGQYAIRSGDATNIVSVLGYTPYDAANPDGYVSNLSSFTTSDLTEGSNLYFTPTRILATVLSGLNVTGSAINSSSTVLEAFGALQNQINGVLGGAIAKGNWNATTNSPSLADGLGTNGWYYITSVGGTTDFGSGPITFAVGDWAIYYTSTNTWNKVDNSDAVVSVNGAIGAVSIAVSGTTNRITVTGGSGTTPTIDISTSYAGQASIVTVGALTSGSIGVGFTAIGNSFLANSSITINGTAISLGASGTVTAAAGTLTGTTLASNVVTSSITTIGTLIAGAVPASLVTAGTFGAGAYTMSTSLSTPSLIGTSGVIAHTSVAQSSGNITDFLFTAANHTGTTTTANSPSFKVVGSTKQWATGTVAAQYWNYLAANTFAFVGASTVTESFGLFVESAVSSGTNLTAITNNYSIGVNGFIKVGATGSTGWVIRNDGGTYAALYSAGLTATSSNYALKHNGNTTLLNGATGGATIIAFNGNAIISVSAAVATFTQAIIFRAGTTSAGTAAAYFGSGNLITTAVTGADEYNGSFYRTKASALRFGLGGIIYNYSSDTGNTTTTKTDLFTSTLPASVLAANGEMIEGEYGGVFVSSGTATREITLAFGGTDIFDTGALTLSLSSAWTIYFSITRVSSTVVRYIVSLTTQGAATSAYTAVGELTGLTLSNTNVLKITGQAAGVGAATNDIVAKVGFVKWNAAANL